MMRLTTVQRLQHLQRTEIELNGKVKFSPFFVLNPTSITDLDVLCSHVNYLNSNQIPLDALGAITYRVFDHDKIVAPQQSMLTQLDLKRKVVSAEFKHLTNVNFKFIDPSTRIYRDRFTSSIKDYTKLEKIPDYLDAHFRRLISLPKDNPPLDETHVNFWKTLSDKNKILHFVQWHYNLQRSRGADIFIPPVPFVNAYNHDFLLEKTFEINFDAWDLVSDDVAVFFNIDAELFRSREAISRILNFIDENPNKCRFVIFKITHYDKILKPGFGLSSMERLALFLRTIKVIKENSDKVFGLLNSGGFGYSLLGTGFDFFTDTISNYDEYPYGRASKKGFGLPRQWLNPQTLTLESFEDVENYWYDHKTLGCHCITCDREYNSGRDFTRGLVNNKKWSVDCKKHGINTWNNAVLEVINSINNKDDSLFLERVQRSLTYTKLVPILRENLF